jgi:hypothetical protein
LPLTKPFACVGATIGGASRAVTGLAVGVYANPPTAPFAVIEAGLPATVAGGVVGLIAGSVAVLARRLRRRQARLR